MHTRHIEKSSHSALAEYAPLSGVLILAALMCFCVFLIANEVKRSSAVPATSVQPATTDEAVALSSPPTIPIAPDLESSELSLKASVMLDRADAQNLASPDRKRTKSAAEVPGRLAKAREQRRPAASSYRISGSPVKESKRVKMLLIALWHRSKKSRKDYTQAGR
jgi:hypothetical protein